MNDEPEAEWRANQRHYEEKMALACFLDPNQLGDEEAAGFQTAFRREKMGEVQALSRQRLGELIASMVDPKRAEEARAIAERVPATMQPGMRTTIIRDGLSATGITLTQVVGADD